MLGLLRGTARNLLRGRCPLWDEETPLTARAEWVWARATWHLCSRLLRKLLSH